MLIRDADVEGRRIDVRIEEDRIAAIGASLPAQVDETVFDADGGALLPGLNDHHIHLASLAASLASVACGPPQVADAQVLTDALRQADTRNASQEWLRGYGYHESVAGEIDRAWLDAAVPDRPVRIQHRSGRLWILNSCALERIASPGANPLERRAGRLTGRLYDADAWLRAQLRGSWPSLRPVSRRLASFGVTGLTDTTPDNGIEAFAHFARARSRGELLQDILLMGDASLDVHQADAPGIALGPRKFHLHENDLPAFDTLCAEIRHCHAVKRAVAFHCVTRVELIYVLGVLNEAGAMAGDRIEHAGIAPVETLDELRALGLTVVTQPNFIAERGDAYLVDVDPVDQPHLYRLRSLIEAGIPLAGSTDAPFGAANPWAAMQAAVTRTTSSGQVIGRDEALTPEQALALFISPLNAPGSAARRIETGATADLCLLRQPWQIVRAALANTQVRATFKAGRLIWNDADGPSG